MAIVSKEQIRAMKGREESKVTEEERPVGGEASRPGKYLIVIILLSRVFDSGGPRARELQLGEQARQPLINNSAGRWRRGGRGRPDRSGLLAASPL